MLLLFGVEDLPASAPFVGEVCRQLAFAGLQQVFTLECRRGQALAGLIRL